MTAASKVLAKREQRSQITHKQIIGFAWFDLRRNNRSFHSTRSFSPGQRYSAPEYFSRQTKSTRKPRNVTLGLASIDWPGVTSPLHKITLCSRPSYYARITRDFAWPHVSAGQLASMASSQGWLLPLLVLGTGALALVPVTRHTNQGSLRSALDAVVRKQRSLDAVNYNDLHSFKYHGGDTDRKFDRDLDEEEEEIEFLPGGKSETHQPRLRNSLKWKTQQYSVFRLFANDISFLSASSQWTVHHGVRFMMDTITN